MKISVYITSYNQKAYLVEAIESVLKQTLKPDQVIIVDDASSDGSQEVIRGYVSRYSNWITPIFHTQNTGVTQSRIDALNAVTGDFVTYVDGDDLLLPQKLEREIKQIHQISDAKIAYSNVEYISKEGIHQNYWISGAYQPPQGCIFWQTTARAFPKMNIFRMELVEYNSWKRIGFHDLNLAIYEDWEMRIRLTKQLKAIYCSTILSRVRRHQQGLSKESINTHLESLKYIQEKHNETIMGLPLKERLRVQTGLRTWEAKLYQGAARRAISTSTPKKSLALKYYFIGLRLDPLHFQPKLFLKILGRGRS